jgi:hypothetical protein
MSKTKIYKYEYIYKYINMLPNYLVEFSSATVEQMILSSKEKIEQDKQYNIKHVKFNELIKRKLMFLSSKEKIEQDKQYNIKDVKFDESIKRKLLLSALSLSGFSFYVQNQRTKSMLQQVVTKISFKIDEAKEEVLQHVTKEFRRQRTIELIGDTSGLIRNLGHFYDSPSKNKLELLLNDLGKHLGSLVAQLKEVEESKLIFHTFALYTLTICIYCLLNFENITTYIEKENEMVSVSNRVLEEIHLIDLRHQDLRNRLYGSIETIFSDIKEIKYEPRKNWLNPWASMYYILQYEFEGKPIEVKRIKIEQTPKKKYDNNPQPHLIIKKRVDGDYYLWPEKDTQVDAHNIAENIRRNHIDNTFKERYKEFILNENEFMMQVDAYRKVFSELKLDNIII